MKIVTQNSLPKIIGYADMPPASDRTASRKSPERNELVHKVLSALTPDAALAIECPSLEEMQTFRCHLLVSRKGQIITRRQGMTLFVSLRPVQLALFGGGHD